MTLLEKLKDVDKSKLNTKSNINDFIEVMLNHFKFYDSSIWELESFILKGYSRDIKLYFINRIPDEDYLNDDYLSKEEKIKYVPTYENDYGKCAIYLKGILVGYYDKDECGCSYMFISEKHKSILYKYLMNVKITLKFYNYEDVLTTEQLRSEF